MEFIDENKRGLELSALGSYADIKVKGFNSYRNPCSFLFSQAKPQLF